MLYEMRIIRNTETNEMHSYKTESEVQGLEMSLDAAAMRHGQKGGHAEFRRLEHARVRGVSSVAEHNAQRCSMLRPAQTSQTRTAPRPDD